MHESLALLPSCSSCKNFISFVGFSLTDAGVVLLKKSESKNKKDGPLWIVGLLTLMKSVLPQPSLLHPDYSSLSTVVSEAFVRFFVEMVGHYSLFMGGAERDDESVSSPTLPSPPSSSSSASSASPSPSSFQREAFRKAVTSKSLRRFLEVFMETQMFTGFIQERELRRQGLKGIGVVLLVSSQSYSVI